MKHKNLEYKKLTDKVSEIIENYPNVLALIKDNEVNSLNVKMTTYEDREIFFLGAMENYFYFKNMNLVKE